MITSLVVPVADLKGDSKAYLEGLLFSIINQGYLDAGYKVIACYDGCREEFVEHFQSHYPFLIPVVNSGNRSNFAGNANRGLRYVRDALDGDCFCVNMDVILPRVDFLERVKGPGLATPSVLSNSYEEGKLTNEVCREPQNGQCRIDTAELETINNAQPTEFTRAEIPKAVGFCLYFSNRILKESGIFDERFVSTFEDDDCAARVLLKNKQLGGGLPVEASNILVFHYVSRCGAMDMNRMQLNLLKYRFKWQIPSEIPHGEFNNWVKENHTFLPEMVEV